MDQPFKENDFEKSPIVNFLLHYFVKDLLETYLMYH
jgi:hypothetical protein